MRDDCLMVCVTFASISVLISFAGEVLSTFSPIPVLISCGKHVRRHCKGKVFTEFIAGRRRSISKGFCFIISGKRDWADQDPEIKFGRDYLNWPKEIWILREAGNYIALTSRTVES